MFSVTVKRLDNPKRSERQEKFLEEHEAEKRDLYNFESALEMAFLSVFMGNQAGVEREAVITTVHQGRIIECGRVIFPGGFFPKYVRTPGVYFRLEKE